ncbi:hypothetical protein Desac_0566 [Desulfobacca acetoxidans DSM 11109]|uniref:Uncharacterized protein n=1 Tax=Desulfobacca acetoxidans (strain ATCC 700848 / DSM 11109 / ASRB2) TaxID=880072 RepID=F2NG39_DESAR|nr:hypothetical protein Desac_0566 [Desulfobacca acetoxidans DSM 11109]
MFMNEKPIFASKIFSIHNLSIQGNNINLRIRERNRQAVSAILNIK